MQQIMLGNLNENQRILPKCVRDKENFNKIVVTCENM